MSGFHLLNSAFSQIINRFHDADGRGFAKINELAVIEKCLIDNTNKKYRNYIQISFKIMNIPNRIYPSLLKNTSKILAARKQEIKAKHCQIPIPSRIM